MRRVSLLFAVVFLLFPSSGWAHRHKAALEGAYQRAQRSSIDGFAGAFEFAICKERYGAKAGPGGAKESDAESGAEPGVTKLPCRKAHPFSILTGVSYIKGQHGEGAEEGELKQLAIGVGPRFTRELGDGGWQGSAHVLVGAIREDLGLGQAREWSFTGSVGVGLDYTLLGNDELGDWELYVGPRFDVSWIAGDDGDVFPEWSISIGIRMP